MPRLISLVNRDPKTHRIDKAVVMFRDKGRELVIKVIPYIAAQGGRTFAMELLHTDGEGVVRLLAETGMDIRDMRAIRDRLTELLDEHFDVLTEMTS